MDAGGVELREGVRDVLEGVGAASKVKCGLRGGAGSGVRGVGAKAGEDGCEWDHRGGGVLPRARG